MEANGNYPHPGPAYPTLERPTWDERLAWWVSNVGSPPVMAGAGVLMCARAAATPSAWAWAAFAITLTILVPVSYVAWLVRRGQVTDFDLFVREQRIRPLLVTTTSALLTWLALRLGTAPPLLVALAGAGLVQTLLMMGITLRWKISAHSAAAAGLAVVAWTLIGQAAAPLVLGVPLVAWSRLRLRRHDLLQTVGGALLGSAVLAAAFWGA